MVDLQVGGGRSAFDLPFQTLALTGFSRSPVELSFRAGMTDESGLLTPVWYALMTDYPDRFLTGMDTCTPGRWVELPTLAAEVRGWLQQLPGGVADKIAYAAVYDGNTRV